MPPANELAATTRRAQRPAANQEVLAFNESINRSLVLNASYQPVKLVSWQKALILWFQGKVEILEYYEISVRSARESFPLPSVMRLKTYVSPRARCRLRFSRDNIYMRDNFTCQYCGERMAAKDLTLDHVVPASKNGRKDWTNVVAACRQCNHRKANRTPLAAGMPLIKEPRAPAWLPAIHVEFRLSEMPSAWEPYLGPSARGLLASG